MLQTYLDIRPGPFSQTTTVRLDELPEPNTMSLAFFDVESPTIESPTRTSWEEAAKEVLEEHAQLWERLSKL